MSPWLTEDEIVELTGYKRQSLQIKALANMGVRFRGRERDGFPIVDRAQFDGAKPGSKPGAKRRNEPDFSSLWK